jgi:hypothetical protein
MYYYCHCYGNSECELPLLTEELKQLYDMPSSEQDLIPKLEYREEVMFYMESKNIIAYANCDDADIYNPFGSEPLSKEKLGHLIVVVDIITIVILILFTWGLENGQRLYLNSFNIHTVEM